MSEEKKIKSALISVYNKNGLDAIIKTLHQQGVILYTTGGTQKFIEELGLPVVRVEDVTDYPEILGGRVKTLHPKIFGGILHRRNHSEDEVQVQEYNIPSIDLVIVDLYPFEETVAGGASPEDIIEKIDIGGISLIRAAAKNFQDVVIIPHQKYYERLSHIVYQQNGNSTLEDRKFLAGAAFAVSANYDACINGYFISGGLRKSPIAYDKALPLRYGENPHQKAVFFGNLSNMFDQLNGKELSYNNLLDIDAAVNLMAEFENPAVAILKHNNACGCAERKNILEAWNAALSADPVSAFGGVIIANREVDASTADAMHSLFFEVLIAPSFTDDAISLLSQKKNRILLRQKNSAMPETNIRTMLNGFAEQDKDSKTETKANLDYITHAKPTATEEDDLLFANKIVKHTKSNTIVLAKNKQLLASGTGQTSRVDALKQAIDKAKSFNFDLHGAAMSSDAFFPFPDCVEIADKAGITAIIQPGGSVKDQLSIDYCNENKLSMVMTGIRHFKH